jgi:hypothetical protein
MRDILMLILGLLIGIGAGLIAHAHHPVEATVATVAAIVAIYIAMTERRHTS